MLNITKLIIVPLFLIFSANVSGCAIVSKKPEAFPKLSPTPTPMADKKVSAEDNRDNDRINDIMAISLALEQYANNHGGQYPQTVSAEKISDETSNVFQILKAGGYFLQLINDPLPDKFYYGYNSDGQSYEITAVLENQSGGRCVIEGNYCLYKFKKGENNTR